MCPSQALESAGKHFVHRFRAQEHVENSMRLNGLADVHYVSVHISIAVVHLSHVHTNVSRVCKRIVFFSSSTRSLFIFFFILLQITYTCDTCVCIYHKDISILDLWFFFFHFCSLFSLLISFAFLLFHF